MTYDYFYGQQSELFTFYRVPKVLFTNERFWNISADAKMLYGILLDRMSLSARNGWIDENGRVYIIFTIDEAKSALNCAEQKAIKLLSELEKKAGFCRITSTSANRNNCLYHSKSCCHTQRNKSSDSGDYRAGITVFFECTVRSNESCSMTVQASKKFT